MSNLPPHPARLTRHALRFDLMVIAAIVLLAFLLYAPSLHYPFVWYDADDLVRAVKYSPAEILAGMPNYPYYRPLIFLFWKVILTAWGPNSAPIFHAYLIGAQILCAVLLYRLVRDLAHDRAIAAVAALLFATYPFSYQALTWSTAQSHPTNLALVLVGAILYRWAREKAGSRLLYLAVAVCLIAAMLVHESAYVGAVIILAIEAYLFFDHRVRRMSLWPVLYFIVTVAVYALYRSVAKAQPVEATLQPETGLYLLQGLIYPIGMLLARTCTAFGCDSPAWLLPVAGVAVLVAVLLWRSGRTLMLGLLGLMWFGLEILPVWAGLDFVYIQYAPRLLYSAGAGAAIALAALLGKEPGVRRQAVTFGLAALVVFQSAQFVIARDPLHADAFRLTDQANQALFAPRQGTAVFINTPELYTYRDREFPLGWYGVLVAPWHNRLGVATNLRADNAAWVIDPARARQVQDQARLKLDFHGQVLPPDQLQTMIVSATQVSRVEALRGDLHLFDIGAIQHNAPRPDSAAAAWDDAVQLVTATIESEAGVPVLNLNWWLGRSIGPDVTVFVHVQDAAGQVVAQADGDLIGGYVPLGAWQNNDQVRERRPLVLPDSLPGGTYTVIIGLYNRATQQRLTPAQSSLPVNDNAIRIGMFDHP